MPDAKATERLAAKAAAVARVLNTEDGKALLDAIEQEFLLEPRRLIGANPQETAYRVGAFDVVRYLQQLQKFHQDGGNKHG